MNVLLYAIYSTFNFTPRTYFIAPRVASNCAYYNFFQSLHLIFFLPSPACRQGRSHHVNRGDQLAAKHLTINRASNASYLIASHRITLHRIA